MRTPATAGAHVAHGQPRQPERKKPAAKPRGFESRTRKSSAGPGVGLKTRRRQKGATTARRAESPRAGSRVRETRAESPRAGSRVRETRAESLRALEANIDRGRFIAANGRAGAAAGGEAGTAAAGALRAAAEVAPRAAAAARPMLEVISGGLDRLPAGTGAAAARGRVLILIAGLLAAGLIYINVGKLEAGDGYARYADSALRLQRENTILRARVAHLDSSERIVALATKQGMEMPRPEQFKYVRGRSGDPLKAIRNYTTPVVAPPVVAPMPAPAPGAAPPVVAPAPTPVVAPSPAPAPGAVAPPATSPGAAGTGGQ